MSNEEKDDEKNLCTYCQKTFSTKYCLNKHQRFAKSCLSKRGIESTIKCNTCGKTLSSRERLDIHQSSCKKITEQELSLCKAELEKTKLELEQSRKIINQILLKNVTDEEQRQKEKQAEKKERVFSYRSVEKVINVISISARNDGYVNVLKLADKDVVDEWFSLEITKQIMILLENEKNIKLIDTSSSKLGSEHLWIHPELAIQFAQWLNPKFSLNVSRWVRTLLRNGSVILS